MTEQMITTYQVDKDNVFLYEQTTGSVPYGAVSVSPPQVGVDDIIVWTTSLCPIRDVTYGTEGTGSWEIKKDNRKTPLYTDKGVYTLGSDYEGQSYNGIGGIPEWLSEVAPVIPAPEPVVPSQVSRRQGRLALHQVGKLSLVEQMISEITDSNTQIEAQIEYEADIWERSNVFLQSMWESLGGTEEELDDLFLLASTK